LQQIVAQKYDEAQRHDDVPQLERFFKIFPQIGLAEDGIEKFSVYLCKQIKEAADANFQLVSQADSKTDARWNCIFADSLIQLFEKVARTIEAYQPVIETYYGHAQMFSLIKNIQEECDVQACKILTRFKQVRRLNAIINACILTNHNHHNHHHHDSSETQKIDPRSLDELLTELTLISARSQLYKSYLTTYLSLKNTTQSFINSTRLELETQELIGQYSILENYFMSENIEKACQLDNQTRGDQETSVVVDDVFFIIKKCLKRCLCSDNVHGCCAMFNNCSAVLDGIYKEYFFSKLKMGYPSSTFSIEAIQRRFQTGVAGSDQMERQKGIFLQTLNNLDMSIEYIEQIKKLFESDVDKLFVQETTESKVKLAECLGDLDSAVCVRFKSLLDHGFDQLLSAEIRPRLKQCADQFQQVNHKIASDHESDSSVTASGDDAFMQTFIKQISQLLASLKSNLNARNQEILTTLIANEVVLHLEKNILKCSFSKYGGLHLDKDIRLLVNYLTSITSWSTRDKFSRLSQFAILLSLESLDELFEYWNSPTLQITWRLTPNEIRQVLLLRVDFKSEEIRRLKL
jgi:hypothetical protein